MDTDGVGDLARGVNEFTQLALYMAATVAGLVTAMLVARRPFFEQLLRSVGGKGAPGPQARRACGLGAPFPPTLRSNCSKNGRRATSIAVTSPATVAAMYSASCVNSFTPRARSPTPSVSMSTS